MRDRLPQMKNSVRFSIKTKFVLLSALIVALFAVTLGTAVIHEERNHLYNTLQMNGRILMTSLKAPIINTMILGELGMAPGLLDNYVEEIVENRDLPTVYAFITDQDGRILAHSRGDEFGKIYGDKLTRDALTGDDCASILVGNGKNEVLDMAMPLRVHGKRWGALRVALSTAPLQRHYSKLKMHTAASVAVIFLVGTGIFYILGSNMSRPLRRLSRSMEEVELGLFQSPPLPPRNDEIGQLQESFNDMLTRLSVSEQDRNRALNHLIQNEKMISIGRIVAGVAHEINNPLAAISACIFRLEGKVPPAAQNCVEILKAAVPRMETIVRQLSDFSRAGTLELREVRSDVFFSEMKTFASMAVRKYECLLFAVDDCTPPLSLHIDKGKMHQVALNLLLNAAAASGFAGPIELRTSVTEDRFVLVVRDRGCGIPEAEQEKIFDIFFTTKAAGEGSGIGLAVCRSIVDLHHGEITVSSRPGDTTFTVSIPLRSGGSHA
jgi:two-component system, NtrC family, sensor kinase